MSKHIILMTLIIIATGTFAADFSSKKAEQIQDLKNNYQKVIILDGGVKRTIYVAKDNQSKNNIQSNNDIQFNNLMDTYDAKHLNAKDGVIVNFKNLSYLSIDDFAEKYGLKFKQKMVIGYYIFDNISNFSDLQVVEKIITNEKNVKTVKPNWRVKADLY